MGDFEDRMQFKEETSHDLLEKQVPNSNLEEHQEFLRSEMSAPNTHISIALSETVLSPSTDHQLSSQCDETLIPHTLSFSDAFSGKMFPRKGILWQQRKVYKENSVFKCPVCERCFKRKSHLIDHERIHSDVRPYTCKICGLSFRQSSTLRRHFRVHFKQ